MAKHHKQERTKSMAWSQWENVQRVRRRSFVYIVFAPVGREKNFSEALIQNSVGREKNFSEALIPNSVRREKK